MRGRRRSVATRVRDDDDLEFQTLRRVDGEQPDSVSALFLRHRLQLARADRFLVAHEPYESFHVGAAQFLVRARKSRELAQVRVAAAAVPAREHGKVVVVLGDDPLAQPLEGETRQRGSQAVIALPEGAQKLGIALREGLRQLALERDEQRPLWRGTPQEHEPVVRDPDERRCQHAHKRLVVVPVPEEPKVREQVDDLLLAEVPAAGAAVGRHAEGAELLFVPLGVRARREEQDDLPWSRVPGRNQVVDAPCDRARLAAPPMDVGSRVRRLLRDEQLDRSAEDRIGKVTGRRQRLELVAEVRAEEMVHDRKHLRT